MEVPPSHQVKQKEIPAAVQAPVAPATADALSSSTDSEQQDKKSTGPLRGKRRLKLLKVKMLTERPERPLGAPDKLHGYEFYRKTLGNPRHIAAPMVDHSILPWRMLARKYNTQLCYTPMLHSKSFQESATYRTIYFSSVPEDKPLIAQFCANNPEALLKAALYVDGRCDAVDLNMGCPQGIARRGGFGAFLIEGDWNIVRDMVHSLHTTLSIPVTCKIRILPSLERTVAFAKMLEEAGCQMLVVHGRTKEQKGPVTGLADWNAIKAVKDALQIPVVANGNIMHFDDIERCMKATGCDGVMSAEALLRNPAFFGNVVPDCFTLAREYIELSRKYPQELRFLKHHLQKLLLQPLMHYVHLKERISVGKSEDDLAGIVEELYGMVQRDDPHVMDAPKERTIADWNLSTEDFL